MRGTVVPGLGRVAVDGRWCIVLLNRDRSQAGRYGQGRRLDEVARAVRAAVVGQAVREAHERGASVVLVLAQCDGRTFAVHEVML